MRLSGTCALWLLATSLLWGSLAAAQAAPQAAERERARQAYARGQELFREGRFTEAEAAFRDAYTMIPLPIVLLGIAEAQERQGNVVGTVETLERYLRERANAPDRQQVERRIGELRDRPAILVISSSPPGATVKVDGAVVARLLGHPVEHQVEPGEHVVEVELAGRAPMSRVVDATFGTRHELSFELVAAEPVVTAPAGGSGADARGAEGGGTGRSEEEGPRDDAQGGGGVPAAVWVAGGISAAGLVAGTVLGFMALSEQSDFDANPTDATADRGERYALFADLAFGVAGVSAVTAIVLLATADEDDEEASESGTASISWGPAVSAQGVGVVANGRF